MRSWFRKGGKVTAETARRITGFSVPFGGVQWADPGPSEAEIVRRFLIFLEDRRVLYNPFQNEIEEQVRNSVREIRRECTDTLKALPASAAACHPIKMIRAACRRFADEMQGGFRDIDEGWYPPYRAPGFFLALGEFRATVGQQVGALAGAHNIDLEGDLASILPRLGDDA